MGALTDGGLNCQCHRGGGGGQVWTFPYGGGLWASFAPLRAAMQRAGGDAATVPRSEGPRRRRERRLAVAGPRVRVRRVRRGVNGPALSSLGSLAFGGGFRVGTELLEEQGGGWKATTPRTRPGCDSELDLQQRAALKVTTNGPSAPAKLIPGPAKRSFVPPPGVDRAAPGFAARDAGAGGRKRPFLGLAPLAVRPSPARPMPRPGPPLR